MSFMVVLRLVLKLWQRPTPKAPSWICPIWPPQREPSLAPSINWRVMVISTPGPKLVLVGRFEQLRCFWRLSPLTICRCCCQIPSDPRDVAEVECGWPASKCKPRLRTQAVTLTIQSPIRNACSLIFLSCWAEPYTITSVLESFNFKEFVFIHLLISVTHCPMLSTAASMSSWWSFTVM